MPDKMIRVSETAYDQLDQLRGKGESFNQVVEALLASRIKVLELMSVLEGQLKFRQWQDQRLRELETARY